MSILKRNSRVALFSLVPLVLLLATPLLRADQVQMQNGDRYVGRLVALTNDVLVVQSELLGTLHLPRNKIALITMGAVFPTNSVSLSSQANHQVQPKKLSSTKADSDFANALRQLQGDTNSLQKIQQQFLGEAGPEANKKFTELAEGLMGGKMDLSDLRAQAASAANQLRSLKREGGNDADSSLDGYLAILESFLKEVPAPSTSVTNRPVQARKSSNPASDDEQ